MVPHAYNLSIWRGPCASNQRNKNRKLSFAYKSRNMLDHVIRLLVRHSTPVFSHVGHFSTARHSPLAFQFPHLRKLDFLKECSFKPLQNFPTSGMKFKSVATPHLSHRGDVSLPRPYFQDPSSNCCVAEVGYKLLGLLPPLFKRRNLGVHQHSPLMHSFSDDGT